MQIIGKINKTIFDNCNIKLLTEEVILTDERIEHIKSRRGTNFFENYVEYFPSVITDPDYIFPDGRKNTILMCKVIGEKEDALHLVIRLVVENDNPNYKNSIITAVKENKKRFMQRLRNHTPIFKKH